jgi:hypothetical protein
VRPERLSSTTIRPRVLSKNFASQFVANLIPSFVSLSITG